MIPRFLNADPGRQKSKFGITLLEPHGMDIWVKSAAHFSKKKYRVMEEYMSKIHKNNPVSHVCVEKNNVGIHVIEDLTDVHHLPVYAITTVNKIVDKKKLLSARTMPKIEHAEWLAKYIENGHLKYPDIDTPGHKLLRTQISKVTKKITQTGTVTYSTDGNEPDDLWMSLMIGTWVIRRLFLHGHSGVIASSRYSTALDYTQSPREKSISAVINRVVKNKYLGTITNVDVEIN